jgi:hypothetical protein
MLWLVIGVVVAVLALILHRWFGVLGNLGNHEPGGRHPPLDVTPTDREVVHVMARAEMWRAAEEFDIRERWGSPRAEHLPE